MSAHPEWRLRYAGRGARGERVKRSQIYREAARMAKDGVYLATNFVYQHQGAWYSFNYEWFGHDTIFTSQSIEDVTLALCFAAAIAEDEERSK